jgi:hypothetical protein
MSAYIEFWFFLLNAAFLTNASLFKAVIISMNISSFCTLASSSWIFLSFMSIVLFIVPFEARAKKKATATRARMGHQCSP